MDEATTIEEMKQKVKKFCEDRDWDQFHNAKELSVAMIIEAAELLDIFRFKSAEEIEQLFADSKKLTQIRYEMADVAFLLLRIAQMYGIDLSEAFEEKLIEIGRKYPLEKTKGKNEKYNEY